MTTDILARAEVVVGRLLSILHQGHSLCATLSGGKDSTCTTILLLEAVRRHKTETASPGRHFVMSADTTIENPAVMWHLSSMLDEIAQGVTEEGLPLAVHIARPSLASQFVVSTIGRGTLPRTAQTGT